MNLFKFVIALLVANSIYAANDNYWIREFSNKKYEWEPHQFQNFSAASFRKLNWEKGKKNSCTVGTMPGEEGCSIIETLPNSENAQQVLNTLSAFELSGISNIQYEKIPVKFKLKKVFSKNIRKCLPAGSYVEEGVDSRLCCTGYINPNTRLCQLKDYIDISVYTNFNISNEAKKLSPNLFDSNGYIKNSYQTATLACVKHMCASGKIALGLLISNLKIPGLESDDNLKLFRYLEGSSKADNANGLLDLYDQGLKLNNHAYCVPANMNTSSAVEVISCGDI